jgi:hypothetical protein
MERSRRDMLVSQDRMHTHMYRKRRVSKTQHKFELSIAASRYRSTSYRARDYSPCLFCQSTNRDQHKAAFGPHLISFIADLVVLDVSLRNYGWRLGTSGISQEVGNTDLYIQRVACRKYCVCRNAERRSPLIVCMVVLQIHW